MHCAGSNARSGDEQKVSLQVRLSIKASVGQDWAGEAGAIACAGSRSSESRQAGYAVVRAKVNEGMRC